MAISQTQICNMALIRLGGPPIISIDDDCKRAIALKNSWDLVRDVVLRDHAWNFAIRRATLARLAITPDFGWTYAYQLPVNCLRVLGLCSDSYQVDPEIEYEIEADQLVTNETTAYCKYVVRLEDTGLYDPTFCSALACRLAAENAYYLTASVEIADKLLKQYYQIELPAAKGIDAQEVPPQVYDSYSWDEARS
jgi:hypothetical protein